MRYLLIGNPNVGKSSLFNLLTNSYAQVGNYGGITVEAKMGRYKDGVILDLPGTYSVSPTSEDEGVVTHALLNDPYDGLINIVDATHLKRNLQLTIQLLELAVPTKIVLNMMDEIEHSGMKLDVNSLGDALGCPVYPISAKTKKGIDELKLDLTNQTTHHFHINYDQVIETAIERIELVLTGALIKANKRWIALQLLEGNQGIQTLLSESEKHKITQIVSETEQEIIASKLALSLKGAIFNIRRTFIESVLAQCLIKTGAKNQTKQMNHKIDRVLTHPIFGFMIFILVMLGVYTLTFDFLGNIISDAFDGWMGDSFTPFIVNLLERFGVGKDHIIMNLVTEGIIAGVGGVLVFIPQIAILFLLLAIIEGTGYMARVAIMLDTMLSKFGLNGKSIVPLITGFGCNVPAIMATRTIADKKERLLTMMIIPFMSCSARIPVYGLLASIFFEKYRGIVILSMYVLGTLVALLSAKLLSLSIFKNSANQFVLEIPPYRLPAARNIYRQTKMMVTDFIEKAGKYILLGAMVLWFLQYVGPNGVATTQDGSFLALIGKGFAPLLAPLGFGNWQSASSLIVGFFAKELIYSSMIVIYGSESIIGLTFDPISAYSFMVFSLLYLPCFATVGTLKQESKSTKFTLMVLSFGFVVAYILSTLIYQIGNIIF
jgi:ferrous iron transport protein B